ncbi:MAG: hypothetical protein M3217_04320, partial [Actinomycetota bacterium]|nr:hypothetical protein [Actinomycetota bacterium]
MVLTLAATAGAATAQSQALTIRASNELVVYGDRVRISGVLENPQPGTPVTIFIRRSGEPAFVPVNNSPIDARGAWTFTFEPTILSSLQARSGETVSPTVVVRVKPRLTLSRRRGALYTQAVAAESFRGRYVWFQRRSNQGRWRSLRKVVLDDPPRRFRTKLPAGISRVRVSLPR